MIRKQQIHLVSAIIFKNEKILLGLRKNTQIYAGYWSLPVGRLEVDEGYKQAIKRELQEELGIKATALKALQLLQDQKMLIQHQVFHLMEWRGEIKNSEPQLCELIKWFKLTQLPQPITPISSTIINQNSGYLTM